MLFINKTAREVFNRLSKDGGLKIGFGKLSITLGKNSRLEQSSRISDGIERGAEYEVYDVTPLKRVFKQTLWEGSPDKPVKEYFGFEEAIKGEVVRNDLKSEREMWLSTGYLPQNRSA